MNYKNFLKLKFISNIKKRNYVYKSLLINYLKETKNKIFILHNHIYLIINNYYYFNIIYHFQKIFMNSGTEFILKIDSFLRITQNTIH